MSRTTAAVGTRVKRTPVGTRNILSVNGKEKENKELERKKF